MCRTFDRRYLRHLFGAGEMLSARLLTLHNLAYYCSLMRSIRDAIRRGRFEQLRGATLDGYAGGPGGRPDRGGAG